MSTCAALVLAATLVGGLSGCRGERSDEPPRQFLPDMDDSPKFRPQMHTDFFEDGRSMRPLVAGTVAFGDSYRADDVHRADYLQASPEMYEGIEPSLPPEKDGTPATVKYMPAEVLEHYIALQADKGVHFPDKKAAFTSMLLRGQQRFNIYCAVCHGTNGEGGDPAHSTGGIVGRRWSYPVPSYHDAKYEDRNISTGTDGHIFRTARYGVAGAKPEDPPKMPAYSDKVNVEDAWAIVAYIRVLQHTWKDNINDVPADLRPALEASKPPVQAAPAAAPGTGGSSGKTPAAGGAGNGQQSSTGATPGTRAGAEAHS